jgi:hypothetical protein
VVGGSGGDSSDGTLAFMTLEGARVSVNL